MVVIAKYDLHRSLGPLKHRVVIVLIRLVQVHHWNQVPTHDELEWPAAGTLDPVHLVQSELPSASAV